MQEKLNDIFRKIQEISVNYGCVEYLSAELGVLKDQIEELMDEMQPYIDKLKDYEDAEEQGLLLKLLCKVGDTVYYKTNNDDIYPIKINEINISNSDITYKGYFMKCTYEFDITDFGKTVFLTKEQAQEALIK